MNKLTIGSLFDGIGGFPLSGKYVGINTLWSSEIDPACEAVTKYHFPEVEQLGDITKIDGATIPPVDIIAGGSPCQSLSIAGKREGMKLQCVKCNYEIIANMNTRVCPTCGDDLEFTRSGLFMEQIRVIREMRKVTNNQYPRYMVWENVPGALSSNKGDDFRAVLEEAARCAENGVSIPQPKKWSTVGNIVGNGWSIAWRILDAQHWGVPQRRRRIFLVADFGSECAGEVLFKPEGLRRNFTEGRETEEGTAAYAERCTDGGCGDGCLTPWDVQSRRVFADSGAWPALYSGEGGGHGYVLINNEKNVKCLNPHDTQSQRIYDASGIYPCLSSNETGGQNRQAICLQANGIDRKLENGCNGKGWAEDVCYTLNTVDRHAVVFTQNQRDEVRDLNGVTAALAAESGMHQTNYVCEKVYSADCRNASLNVELSGTLQAKSNGGFSYNCVNPVLFAFQRSDEFAESNVTSTESARQYKFATDLVVHKKSRKYIIRRLTPLECERLQGFPDEWCNVSFKNKPMSDSARYRMCGNSVAIPCVVRVLGGIVECAN